MAVDIKKLAELLGVQPHDDPKIFVEEVRAAYGNGAAALVRRYIENGGDARAALQRLRLRVRPLLRKRGIALWIAKEAALITAAGGLVAAALGFLPGTIVSAGAIGWERAIRKDIRELQRRVVRDILGTHLVALALLNMGHPRIKEIVDKYRNLLAKHELYPYMIPKALRYLAERGVNIYNLSSVLGPWYVKDLLERAGWPTDAPFRRSKDGKARELSKSVSDLEELAKEIQTLLDRAYIEVSTHPAIPEHIRELLRRLELDKESLPADIHPDKVGDYVLRIIEEKYDTLAAAYVAKRLGINEHAWMTRARGRHSVLVDYAFSFPWGRHMYDEARLNLGKVAVAVDEKKHIKNVKRSEALKKSWPALKELRI